MKYLIIIMVLAMIVVGGGVFFGLRIIDMSDKIQELENSYATLQISYNTLQVSHGNLESKYQLTLNNYNLLDADHKALQSNFTSLQADYKSLQSDHNTLEGKVTMLQANYDKLQNENDALQKLLNGYENVPHSYYSAGTFTKHSNTFNELSEFLTFEFVLPRGYEESVFDCSESSAYLEWALENAGFNAVIAVGRTPWDTTSGRHAWVIAYTADYRVAIEATTLTGEYNWAYLFIGRVPGIVYGKDSLIPGWENYYEGYDKSYRNIYYAIRDFGAGYEWNWWEGFFGFE